MAAYNKVDGDWCTANKFLLTDLLRDQWHFQGVLMSDWGAAHDTLGPLNAGLDLEMHGEPRVFYNMKKIPPLLAGGQLTQPVLDEHVRRILRLIVTMGLMDQPPAEPPIPLDDPQSAATALRVASEGIVLLKNEKSLLPLQHEKIRSLVVLGPNASPAVIGGGGSGGTQPFNSVSVLEALKTVAGANVKIQYLAGSENSLAAKSVFAPQGGPAGADGLSAEYFNNATLEGEPVVRRIDRPVQELKGFERVELKAGESKTVTLPLVRRDFARYDEKSASWIVPPGDYQIAIGRSSRDITGTCAVAW